MNFKAVKIWFSLLNITSKNAAYFYTKKCLSRVCKQIGMFGGREVSAVFIVSCNISLCYQGKYPLRLFEYDGPLYNGIRPH